MTQQSPASADSASATGDSLSSIILSPDAAPLPKADEVAPPAVVAPDSSVPAKKPVSVKDDVPNIVPTTKNIRAFGWGEYRVGGRCLCCDNMLDGDCIIVHNTNRTDRLRIKQIVDGRTDADTSDRTTYFGDVQERERTEPVTLLMAEITLPKPRDIRRVTVHTMVDTAKGKSYLSSCELGYYDQFDRLQWAGKLENPGNSDHITFDLDRPILTSCILLKVRGGSSRITEVGIFAGELK
jgi:hypothetical protein